MSDDLGYYCLMAKNSRGGATAEVVSQALSSPNVFVFGELLSLPSVAELAGSPATRAVHELLLIFTYGTYMEYQGRKAELGLPDLSPAQLRKLQQLSIVALAAKNRALRYSDLQAALEIPDVRHLEDVIIDAITNNLMQAKLDQAARSVEVLDVVGRDVKPEDIDAMIETLTAWHESSILVSKELDLIINKGKTLDEERMANAKELQAKIALATTEKGKGSF